MFWSALAAATEPEPMPVTLDEAAERATSAATWVEENWSTWLNTGLRILLILVVALLLRTAVRRALTKLIERMNRSAQAVEGRPWAVSSSTPSGGGSARRPSGRCCARWRPS